MWYATESLGGVSRVICICVCRTVYCVNQFTVSVVDVRPCIIGGFRSYVGLDTIEI